MQRIYADRETYGPEFDNRLIRLVKANPAIYDVSHKHYRRNPVRVTIWDKIAKELNAPSKFLQTKWKNIRYNYLQEIKCMETGHTNANIRKRRFTEDLSFLQNTAQTYNVKKGAATLKSTNPGNSSDNDNDSDSIQFTPPNGKPCEVIEIENSDASGEEFMGHMHHDHNSNDGSVFPVAVNAHNGPGTDHIDEPMNGLNGYAENGHDHHHNKRHRSSRGHSVEKKARISTEPSSAHFYSHSSLSSPLLTPLVVMGNGHDNDLDEVTIEPIGKETAAVPPKRSVEVPKSTPKRKQMHAPYPVVTPINDPIELYCLSLVDSLRSMPRSERERVKFEFAKILKDAKYKDDS